MISLCKSESVPCAQQSVAQFECMAADRWGPCDKLKQEEKVSVFPAAAAPPES